MIDLCLPFDDDAARPDALAPRDEALDDGVGELLLVVGGGSSHELPVSYAPLAWRSFIV
jgi:hypothetical protein